MSKPSAKAIGGFAKKQRKRRLAAGARLSLAQVERGAALSDRVQVALVGKRIDFESGEPIQEIE